MTDPARPTPPAPKPSAPVPVGERAQRAIDDAMHPVRAADTVDSDTDLQERLDVLTSAHDTLRSQLNALGR